MLDHTVRAGRRTMPDPQAVHHIIAQARTDIIQQEADMHARIRIP